jgi:hypothetical protein
LERQLANSCRLRQTQGHTEPLSKRRAYKTSEAGVSRAVMRGLHRYIRKAGPTFGPCKTADIHGPDGGTLLINYPKRQLRELISDLVMQRYKYKTTVQTCNPVLLTHVDQTGHPTQTDWTTRRPTQYTGRGRAKRSTEYTSR